MAFSEDQSYRNRMFVHPGRQQNYKDHPWQSQEDCWRRRNKLSLCNRKGRHNARLVGRVTIQSEEKITVTNVRTKGQGQKQWTQQEKDKRIQLDIVTHKAGQPGMQHRMPGSLSPNTWGSPLAYLAGLSTSSGLPTETEIQVKNTQSW